MTLSKYLIGANGDQHWQDCNATTLRGAMRCATNYYQQTVAGKISVAEYGRVDKDSGAREIVPVAVKYGHDKWQIA